MAEDIFLPGKFTDLTNIEQLSQLNELLFQMLERLNQIDPASIVLAWIQGAATGQVIASKGVANAPEWDATPLLTGLTLSGLTGSQLVATNSSKELVSDGTNYLIGVGTNTITVGPDEPTNPQTGDLWIDTSL